MATITTSRVIDAGLALMPKALSRAPGALFLYGLANWGFQIFTRVMPLVIPRSMSGVFSLLVLACLPVLCIAAIPATGAILRMALADGQNSDAKFRLGPGGLQWRAMEWRLLGVSLAANLILILMFVVVTIIAVLVLVMLGSQDGIPFNYYVAISSPLAVTATIASAIALSFPALWVWCRLATNLPATADQDRFRLFSTWPYTRGAFWPLAIGFLALFGVNLVLALIAGILNMGVGFLEASMGVPEQFRAFLPLLISSMAGAALLPAGLGMTTFVYRAARPAQTMASVFD
jgi:hypothetical protein